MYPVETHGRASLRDAGTMPEKTKMMPVRVPGSISSFVAGFKSIATKRINELRGTPGRPVWQTHFYDVIIRNDVQLRAIRKYIEENPVKWRQGESEQVLALSRGKKT